MSMETILKIRAKFKKELAPPESLSIDEWADIYRRIPKESSPEPGRWSTDKVAYHRQVYADVKNPDVKEIICMEASQVAKTEKCLNIVGYHIDRDPCPMLYLLPSLPLVQAISKDRFTPMVRETPVLHKKISEERSRDSSNTIEHKSFEGGTITFIGGGSAPSLASRPIRLVLADEYDRIGAVGGEGSAAMLAKRRTSNFWNRKFIAVSSPTRKATSRIYQSYQAGKRHVFTIPCAHCGEFIELKFEQLHWQDDRPDTARYECQKCGAHLKNAEIKKNVKNGKWHCLDPEKTDYRKSYKLSALYSRWVSLEDFVHEYLDAKSDIEKMIVFTNTYLGEPFEENTEGVEHVDLYMRREQYAAPVPEGVLVLVAGVDLQGDRGEILVQGFGYDYECWTIEHRVIRKSPQQDEFWEDLDHFLMNTRYDHELGPKLRIVSALIDSGDGKITNRVYQFCSDKAHRNIWPSKGKEGEDRALATKSTARTQATKGDLFVLGVDEAKTLIYQRLMVMDVGPGYYHYPFSDFCDRSFFKQLKSEKVEITFKNGYKSRKWIKKKEKSPNEILDLHVMALCACVIINPIWGAIYENMFAGIKEEGARAPDHDDEDEWAAPQKSWAEDW